MIDSIVALRHRRWIAVCRLYKINRETDLRLCKQGKDEAKYHLVIIDCTLNPRRYARQIVDRRITHFPNNPLEKAKHWVIPILTKRVESCTQGNEVGMEQIVESINTLDLEQEFCVTVGDNILYGTEQ